MPKASISQDELKEFLHYCPDTGVFTWLKRTGTKKTSNRIYPGKLANSKDANGYIVISVNNNRCYAHRLAFLYMTGSFPVHQVDHINHDRSDNRWTNLRQATGLQNSKNSPKHRGNTSGITGVSWSKQNKKWHAYISHKNKRIPLGHYDTKLAAAYARHQANLKYGYHQNHGKINPE